jgi:RNA polymerase sigma factor (TIGR02999 family)
MSADEHDAGEPRKPTDKAPEPLDSRRLFEMLYDELRKYARSRMAGERTNHTLQATAVVHEAWIRLGTVGRQQDWNSRGHFFASMARQMRQLLVDHARKKAAVVHGGGVKHHAIDDFDLPEGTTAAEILDLDRALEELEKIDRFAADVVTLRSFAGMTIPEIAEQMDCSQSTVDRTWKTARKWLLVELRGGEKEWLTSVDGV